jgi:hypothetical protein
MRRKDPRNLPSLPLSAFTPPNTGTSEQFPVSSSPSTVHPKSVVDGHVIAAGGNLSEWKKETGQSLGGRIGGVVLFLEGTQPADVERALAELESTKESAIIAIAVPFSLETTPPATPPSSAYPISLSTIYAKSVPEPATSLKWALEQGRALDLDVQCDITENDTQWETFLDVLAKAMAEFKATPVVLSNVLPPPADSTLSMVKLMNHPSYRAYQSHIAALSLFPNLYVKFLPPAWNAPTPTADVSEGSKETHEWKRRIKMYLGPVLEAFGFQRIIFGTSPSSTSTSTSHAGDWYEIARECLAELNVEQEAIDGVFSDNAKKVYGSSS